MEQSRVSNSLRNMIFGLGGQMLSILMGFCTRWVFIVLLGKEYLGVSGLFSNILSLLALANLGFDSAIIYSLYKPLAQGDMTSVKGYMQLYRKVYSAVGILVFVLGSSLMPFLPRLINGEVTIPENLYLIYFLFLLQSASSYFFSYKQSLLTASQQGSVISKNHALFMIVRNLTEVLLLVVFHAYIPTLIGIVACQIAENIWLARVTDKMFPVLTDDTIEGFISEEQLSSLKKNVKALLLYKISGTVISSTDNILISRFQGLISVGLYSNYAYIVDVIRTCLSYIFYSLTASVGNYSVSESKEKNQELYYLLFFASFWFYGFTSICLGVLINPFIALWLGNDFLLPGWTVLIIIINYYSAGVQYASTTYREVTGLFAVGKYRPLIAAALNLIISIILGKRLGIAGVLLGTILSRLAIYFWFDPYIIHKRVFAQSAWRYFLRYGIYLSATAVVGAGTYFLCAALPVSKSGIAFILSMLICGIVPNLMFVFLFRKTNEYRTLKNYTIQILNRFKGKIKNRREQ